MRTKINRLARGIFNSNVPEIVISETKIEKSLNADRQCNGCFNITSVNNFDIRGMVCSDNYRVEILNKTFAGRQAIINYEINTRGLVPGDKIQGAMSIICNAGEFSIMFVFEIKQESIDTSMGEVKDFFHFTNLVQRSYDEALSLFCSKPFSKIILRDNPEYVALYECLMAGGRPKNALEEFLVYVNKKKRITFTLESGGKKEYNDLYENFADKLVIRKENWGYGELSINSFGDFIQLTKNYVTTEEFAGGVCEIPYLLDYKRFHAGKNYGRIIISLKSVSGGNDFAGQDMICDIVVNNSPKDTEKSENRIEVKKCISRLSELYFAFRMKRISDDIWIKQSVDFLKRIRNYDDSSDFLRLYQAHIHVVQKRPEEALWLINNVADHLLAEKKRNEFLYSYYLYVRMIYSKESGVISDALAQIRAFYERSGNDWRIMWILLYIDEEYYVNKSLRLARVKEQYINGLRSPFFYFEACAVFNEQPMLLRVLEPFEISALYWGCRNDMLNEKIAFQVAEIVSSEKKFNPLLYKIMAHFCEKYNEKILLAAFCSYLICNTSDDEKYYKWYEKAINSGLKIAGLYEKYIRGRDRHDESPLPQMVALYFAYNNALLPEQKEYLYANMLRNEKIYPGVTKNYIPQIKRFALEQIAKGNVSVNLAYIYAKVIKKNDINEKIAKTYPAILLAERLLCKNEWLARTACAVIVKHKEFEDEERYELLNGETYFPVYSDDVSIVFVDREGRRFCARGMYERVQLMKEKSLMGRCFELDNEDIRLCVHICETEGIYRPGGESGIALYKRTVEYKELKQYYKNQLYSRMIDYFSDNYDGDNLDTYLKKIDTDCLGAKERTRVTELLLIRRLYDDAYVLMKSNGYDNISPNRLMRFCTMHLLNENTEEDTFITGLCAYVFNFLKYDERILVYLLKYYKGTTKSLLKLWNAARDFMIDITELEERLIVQMLFTDIYLANVIDVFEVYYSKGHTSLNVIQAYLNTQSYLYFVENAVISEKIFGYLEHEIQIEHELQPVAKMALVKYYSERSELSDKQKEIAGTLIRELGRAGYIFAFYQNFFGKLDIPEELNDKMILEYRTEPKKYVKIDYLFLENDDEDGEYKSEVMEECYEGIFVRPFIMFYGEDIKYYITENQGDEASLTESGNGKMEVWRSGGEMGSYEILNDICTAAKLHDEKTLNEIIMVFEKKKNIAEEYFNPIT